MKMTLKNRMLVSMDKLIKQTNELGGIPNTIELSTEEAAEFILEIHSLQTIAGTKDITTITPSSEYAVNPEFGFWGTTTLDEQAVTSFVKDWIDGKYQVEYMGILIEPQTPDWDKQATEEQTIGGTLTAVTHSVAVDSKTKE